MKKFAALLALLLVTTTAHAHSGHGAHGFLSGLAHPFNGWDHLLAMLCVGLWAGRQTHGKAWSIPLAFAGVLTAGLGVGLMGLGAGVAEAGIALSLLVLGLMLTGAVRLPLTAAYGLVAVFALFHGAAHGAEIPAGAGVVPFTVGMLVATLALHFSAFAAARATRRGAWLWRAAGVLVSALGMVALVG